MSSAATWLLTLTVAAGTILALLHLRASEGIGHPPLWMGVLHGLAGVVGLGVLLVALRGPERGIASGVGGFGRTASWLFAGAVASGVLVWIRRRKGPAIPVILHAGIAVTAWVLLLAWNALG